MKHAAICITACMLAASSAAAQQPRVAVVPDSITVGRVFHVAVRQSVPLHARVEFPDTLAVPDHVEAAARLELVVDTTGVDSRTFTGVWALTAWRPGAVELPSVTFRIVEGATEQAREATLPAFEVRSVLPEDTAGVEPRAARAVIGPDRLIWPLLLIVALILALLAAGLWAWRRWRPVPEPVVLPSLPPRVEALLALDRLAGRGLLERGDVKTFVFGFTGILRTYMAAIEPAWNTHLTTAELAAALEKRIPPGADDSTRTHALPALLSRADLVKFARRPGTAAEAAEDCDRVRRWIETFDWPPPVAERAA